MAAILSMSGAVFASPALPDRNAGEAAVVYQVNQDLQVVTDASNASGDVQVSVIDHNPSDYQRKEQSGHVLESWIQDNTVCSTIDGQQAASYKINGAVDQIAQVSGDGENIITIDHNPNCYQKKTVGNHVLESWIENDTAYSKLDGQLTKAYKINGDQEVISYGDDQDERVVVDHNPQSYTKTEVAGHAAEGWMQNGTAYTKEVR